MTLLYEGQSDFDRILARLPGSRRSLYLSSMDSTFREDVAILYIKYGLTTRRAKILLSPAIGEVERFRKLSEAAVGAFVDPFAFICCAVSEFMFKFSVKDAIVEK